MITYDERTNLYLDTTEDIRTHGYGITDPEMRGGWMIGGLGQHNQIDTFELDEERKKARLHFSFNFLVSGAVDTVHSFVIGDKLTYGDINDQVVMAIVEDFWVANDFSDMAERYFYEFMVDGENATLFPVGKTNKNEPVVIAFPDVVLGVEVDKNKITRKFNTLKFRDIDSVFTPENCIWSAHRSLWNGFRGKPVIMGAIDPAVAYIDLLNHRIRVHELQGRLNAVYKAFVDYSKSPLDAMQQQKAKASIFGKIPRHGGIITLGKNIKTGESEEMEFLQGGKGSSDGEKDARLLALGVSVALGIPLTWIWTGDTANRSTADSMTEPAMRNLAKHQGRMRNWLDKVFRMEVIRRLGPGYLVEGSSVTLSPDGLTRTVTATKTPIERYYFPWNFPSLDIKDLAATVEKTRLANELGLASKQTLSGELGYDYSLELELLSAAGVTV